MRACGLGMNFAFAGLLSVLLILPAGAQTTQTTPGKSTPSITTPTPGTAGSTSSGATAPRAPTTSSGLVDINTASAAELDALPGIGKTRAAAIIKNRPYKGKDDLLSKHVLPKNVYDGIKNKVIAKQG